MADNMMIYSLSIFLISTFVEAPFLWRPLGTCPVRPVLNPALPVPMFPGTYVPRFAVNDSSTPPRLIFLSLQIYMIIVIFALVVTVSVRWMPAQFFFIVFFVKKAGHHFIMLMMMME